MPLARPAPHFGFAGPVKTYQQMIRTTPGLSLFWPGVIGVSSSVANYSLGSAFTMETWVKWTTVQSNIGILSAWAGGAGSMLVVDVGTNAIRLYCTSTGLDTVVPVAGFWYHIVGMYDGTNRSVYINGTLKAGPSSGVTPGAGGTPLISHNYAGSGSGNLIGIISDTAIYTRALTPSEIAKHYNLGLVYR